MKTIKFKHWNCSVWKSHYHHGGNPSITLRDLITGEPIAVASINLEDLRSDEVAIKEYSGNEGMYEVLLAAEIIEPAHRYTSSGYVENIPVCKIKI